MSQLQTKIIACIVAAGISASGYLLVQSFPSRAEVMALELRIASIKSDLDHVPTSHDVSLLRVLLGRVDERLSNIERVLTRIQEAS